MSIETTTGVTASGRSFTVKSDTSPLYEVRIDGSDRGEPHPSYAGAGVGMTADGNIVIVYADIPQTLRELGEALIAAAEQIETRESGSDEG